MISLVTERYCQAEKIKSVSRSRNVLRKSRCEVQWNPLRLSWSICLVLFLQWPRIRLDELGQVLLVRLIIRLCRNWGQKKPRTNQADELYLLSFCCFSDEGPMLETLDYTIRIGSTPTFLYFDLYLCSAYAAHFAHTCNQSLEIQKTKVWRPCWCHKQKKLLPTLFFCSSSTNMAAMT